MEYFGIIAIFLLMLTVPSGLMQWGASSGHPIAVVVGAVMYVAYLACILYRIDSNVRRPVLSILLVSLLRVLAVCGVFLILGFAAVWGIWMHRSLGALLLHPKDFLDSVQQVIRFLSEAIQRSRG